jgi:hypothetical protein
MTIEQAIEKAQACSYPRPTLQTQRPERPVQSSRTHPLPKLKMNYEIEIIVTHNDNTTVRKLFPSACRVRSYA